MYDTKGVADGLVRTIGKTVATPPLRLEEEKLKNVTSVTGTYFDLVRCNILNSEFVAGKETRLVRFRDCAVVESSIRFEAEGPPVAILNDGNRGELAESGPGIAQERGREAGSMNAAVS